MVAIVHLANGTRTMQVNHIDLIASQRAGVIDLLGRDLTAAYLLLVKTQKYDWEIVGSEFPHLHQLLAAQQLTLSENINLIDRRSRSLGGCPASIMAGCWQLFSIEEHREDLPTATGLVDRLVADRQQIVRTLHEHVDICREIYQDRVTANLLADSIEEYERMTWMLRLFIHCESTIDDRSNPSVIEDLPNDWIFGMGAVTVEDPCAEDV